VNPQGVLRDRAAAAAEAADPYAGILKLTGDADVVLIGEASHGTHEFYRERAAITRRLIEQHGFAAVAVEADWPDTLRRCGSGAVVSYRHQVARC
jgi:erythromycin esterase-like protein